MASHVPSVGHDVLDAQHEAIASVLELTKKRVEADDPSGTARALAALWDEAVNHFTLEEALMEKFSYPELAAHRASHQLFLEDLRGLIRELEQDGLTAEVRSWACQRIPDWITFHIETNDILLGRYLARRIGQGPASAGSRGGVPAPRPKRFDA
jgi:hemerythrin